MSTAYNFYNLDEQTQMLNQLYLRHILEGDVKRAQEIGNDFIRTRMVEDGVTRAIMGVVPITKDDLDRMPHTDQPLKIVERQPGSPGAVSIPLGINAPPMYYIRGSRFVVPITRLSTHFLRKDEAELLTYRADIKQLLAEVIVKDLSWREDADFINGLNTILGGSAGSTNLISGLVQWNEVPGGVSRVGLSEAFAYAFIPPTRAPVKKILANGVLTARLFAFDRTEVGGDDAQDILYNGWGNRKLNNADVITSIKRELIPDDTIYMFADPNFIGVFFELQAPSMYIKREDTEIQFRAHEMVGLGIGHGDAFSRIDFVASST